VIDSIDAGIMALSTDGAVAVKNQQWVDLAGGEVGVSFTVRNAPSHKRGSSSTSPRPGSSICSPSTWHPSLTLTDLEFTHQLDPMMHPLYQAAILGQVVKEFRCGGIRLDSELHHTHLPIPADSEILMDLDENPCVPESAVSTPPTHLKWEGLTAYKGSVGDESPISNMSEVTETLKASSPALTLSSLPGEAEVGSCFSEEAVPVISGASFATPDDIVPDDVPNSQLAESVPQGTKLILEIAARPMRDVRGELVGGVITIRDVTQREKERIERVQHESDMRESSPDSNDDRRR
jgi:hypothetical protein